MMNSTAMDRATRFAPGLLILLSMLSSACTHQVNIKSDPPGAKVFVDDEERGETPLLLEEENGFFEQRQVRVELEGYQTIETAIVQSEPVWACVGPSICLAPFSLCTSCIGLRYATKYAEEYELVLDPIRRDGSNAKDDESEAEELDPEMTIPY